MQYFNLKFNQMNYAMIFDKILKTKILKMFDFWVYATVFAAFLFFAWKNQQFKLCPLSTDSVTSSI